MHRKGELEYNSGNFMDEGLQNNLVTDKENVSAFKVGSKIVKIFSQSRARDDDKNSQFLGFGTPKLSYHHW